MATKPQAGGEMELRLIDTGAVWFGDLEAQGGDHMRVRLRPDVLGALPCIASDAALECSMDDAEGRYRVEAVALDQNGPLLWLRMGPVWGRTERRQNTRAAGGFRVSYHGEDVRGVGACMDIGAGGMRLRLARMLPLRSRVQLCFQLPGEPAFLHLEGMVLYARPAETGTGMDNGIKFRSASLPDAARLARYCTGG